MGRLILLLLIIVVIVLVWKAFGPESRQRYRTTPAQPQIKGPDDGQTYFMELHSYLVRQNDPFNR